MNDDPVVLERGGHSGAIVREFDDSVQGQALHQPKWTVVGDDPGETRQENAKSDGIPTPVESGTAKSEHAEDSGPARPKEKASLLSGPDPCNLVV